MHPKLSMNLLHSLMKSPGGAMIMFVLVIMLQYIFKLNFLCPCDPTYNRLFTGLYVGLPFGIVSLIAMLIEPRCTWKCKLYGCKKWAHRSSVFNSLLLGSVWVITALIEGDIITCLIPINGNWTLKACIDKTSRTDEQQSEHNIYLNISRMSGLGIILILTLAYALHNFWNRRKKKSYRETLSKKYTEEHVETILIEEESTNSKKKAKEEVKNATLAAEVEKPKVAEV